MKKTILAVFSCICLLAIAPLTQASSTQDELSEILENTILNDYMQAEGEAELTFGDKNGIFYEFDLTQKENLIKTEADITLEVDTTALPESLKSEMDLDELSEFTFKGNTTAKTYFDEENSEIYYELSNYKTELNSNDDYTQTVLDGFLEFPKFFTDKMYHLNFADLIEKLGSNLDELESLQFKFNTISKSEKYTILNALLQTGFVEVSKKNNTYQVNIPAEITEINFNALADAIKNLEILPEELKTEIINALNGTSLDQNDLDELNEFLKFIEFKCEIEVANNKISSLNCAITFLLKDFFEANSIPLEIEDLHFEENIDFEYQNRAITWPSKPSNEIDINKIINAFVAIEEKIYAEWNSDDTYEEWDSGYSYYETINQQYAIDMTSFLDENAWYTPHIRTLISKNVIVDINELKNMSLTQSVSPDDYLDFLTMATDYFNEYSLSGDMLDEFYSIYGTETAVSKYDALKYIIKALFPDNKEIPVTFAVRNGIISAQTTRESLAHPVSYAEFFKMLNVAMEVKATQ